MGIRELELYQSPTRLMKVINSAYDPVLTLFLSGTHPIAAETHILFDQIKISLNSAGKNIPVVEFIKGLQERFEVHHIAVWAEHKLQVCSEEWYNMHTTDKQLLSFIIQSRDEEGLLFADMPVYLTHTSLRDDLGAIGTVPFRYLMFNL